MNRFRKIASLVLPLLAVGFCLAVPAVGQAALIQVTGSGTVQGQSVSAEADFTVLANGNLQITLANTAAATPDVSQVLSNIEFNLNGGAVVFDPTKSSVTLASASNLVDNGSIVDYSLNP